jgi:hypothetical protein
MGSKIRTEADRIATPKPKPIAGTNLKNAGGQRISKERGSHTRNKKNAGKRAHQGGG